MKMVAAEVFAAFCGFGFNSPCGSPEKSVKSSTSPDCIVSLFVPADDPEMLTRLSNAELVEQAGSEGVELIMWLAMRGAMTRGASVVHSHYHIPVSNTAAGVLVLENTAAALAAA